MNIALHVEVKDVFEARSNQKEDILMSRVVFIDVGGHRGETLEEISKPIWLFDRIFCFEPQLDCVKSLRERFTKGNIRIIPAALDDATGTSILFGSEMGASLFEDKADIDRNRQQQIHTLRATEFFRKHIHEDDLVIMKLNCEGAEGRILRDLMESDELHKIGNVMIDFDLHKIRSMRSEPRRILRMLTNVGFRNYFLAEDVMVGTTHASRIRNWLAHVPQLNEFCVQPDVIAAGSQEAWAVEKDSAPHPLSMNRLSPGCPWASGFRSSERFSIDHVAILRH